MAPNVHEASIEKCVRYARGLSNLGHDAAEGLFWGCFGAVLILLMIVGILFVSATNKSKAFRLAVHKSEWHSIDETDMPALRHAHIHAENRLLRSSSICFLIMFSIVVLEAFAGLNINFCHHEDLIMFYWGPFWLASVGSMIATAGLVISQVTDNAPAWNVALGTPVLVFAAIGTWVHDSLRKGWRKLLALREEVKDGDVESLDRKQTSWYMETCEHCNDGSRYAEGSAIPMQRFEDSVPLTLVGSKVEQSPKSSRTSQAVTETDLADMTGL